jgi:5'(3')-deoxyribonucleotidase
VADFYKAAKGPNGKVIKERMFDNCFFLNLDPVPGAQKAVFRLEKMGFDIYLLSQPFVLVPESYTEKVLWIQRYFPQLIHKNILTQNKGLNIGHYLIDNNPKKWKEKFEKNGGVFIHFPYGGYNLEETGDPEQLWNQIVEFFKTENPYID